jgi:hypothetical protein
MDQFSCLSQWKRSAGAGRMKGSICGFAKRKKPTADNWKGKSL